MNEVEACRGIVLWKIRKPLKETRMSIARANIFQIISARIVPLWVPGPTIWIVQVAIFLGLIEGSYLSGSEMHVVVLENLEQPRDFVGC